LDLNPETSVKACPRWLRAGSVIAALLGIANLCPVVTAAPAPCPGAYVGVDSTAGTVSGELILGMAWGQSFVAADTVLLSATVWRIPSEAADPSPLKFWITEVDSSGTPHTHLVVYEGQTISVVAADTSRPTPIVYTFDPPVHLPRPGPYCFWVQEVCTGYADLLIDPHDDYAGGSLWNTHRSDFDGCILRDFPRSLSSEDLAFRLEFCDAVVPVRRSSWGQVKARYR
jgi:hypothetical protein